MIANRMSELATAESPLGSFLRDRRTRLDPAAFGFPGEPRLPPGPRTRPDPAAFGFPGERRRTPGLRREEVAQRANISPTWYTWLEQGRGGAPAAGGRNPVAPGRRRAGNG